MFGPGDQRTGAIQGECISNLQWEIPPHDDTTKLAWSDGGGGTRFFMTMFWSVARGTPCRPCVAGTIWSLSVSNESTIIGWGSVFLCFFTLCVADSSSLAARSRARLLVIGSSSTWFEAFFFSFLCFFVFTVFGTWTTGVSSTANTSNNSASSISSNSDNFLTAHHKVDREPLTQSHISRSRGGINHDAYPRPVESSIPSSTSL
jgi:hypothetical protein